MAGETSTDRHKPANNFRKSRWDPPSAIDPKSQPPKPNFKPTSNPNPNPNPNSKPKASPNPIPSPKPNLNSLAGPSNPYQNHRNHPPPPQPTYGFHMLERRTIALADGSVRTYHALPPDYQDFPAPPPQRMMILPPHVGPGPIPGPFRHHPHPQDYWNSLGLEPGKRKFEDERYGRGGVGDESSASSSRAAKLARPNAGAPVVATKHLKVDSGELKKAFLRFVKAVNETSAQRRSFLEKGKHSRLNCLACPANERSSKDFADTHSLVMHSYNWDKTDSFVDHLGLHKALCALMGWNYSIPPDNSKVYQHLSADEAAANQDDLVLWPPVVIIHNTLTGKSKEGRMEGLGNKYMDTRIRDLGISGGKSKSLYGREGHLGLTLVKFSGNQAGLNEATRLGDHFERENHGRRAWFCLQPLIIGGPEDENNPNLVNSTERSRDKRRIFYGYLGTSRDIEKVDLDTRKKIAFESLREYKPS